MTDPQLTTRDLQGDRIPLLIALMEPITVGSTSPELGAMTKYKTFNGETIEGQKVWHYDYHDDDV